MNDDEYIQKVLSSIRRHMQMDVAFIARFTDDSRLIEYTATAKEIIDPVLKPDDCSPKSESYCQKIVDNELPNIIPDTSKNTITAALTVTKTLNIGSYIGVCNPPILSSSYS